MSSTPKFVDFGLDEEEGRPSGCGHQSRVASRRVASLRIARESVGRARARPAAHKRGSQHGSVQISQRIPWELAGSQVSPHGQGGRGSQARCHGQAGSRGGGGDQGVCMAPRHPDWECTTPSVPPEGGRSEEHFVRVPMIPGKIMWANAGVELEVEPAPMREE